MPLLVRFVAAPRRAGMTAIDFYFNADDRLQVACRLAAKALAAEEARADLRPAAGDSRSSIDRMLWTCAGDSASCRTAPAHDPLAAETPVLIAGERRGRRRGCEVLLNLAADCPPVFERFERLLEVVPRTTKTAAPARARYRFYRDRGYAIRNHDLAGQRENGAR